MTERYIYALDTWTVEKRRNGWWYARTFHRKRREDWRGPFKSEASVTLMIARELRREIARRHERQTCGRAA